MKLNLFKECMNEVFGFVNEDFISITPKRFENGGYNAAKKLIESGNIPRAVICAYDNMAIGAIRCFKEHNFSVPKDIAILGMDDNQQSAFLIPSLSSINPQRDKSCRIACDQILNILNGNKPQKNLRLDGVLILRESTKIN